ncbi:MAG: hypothetical protein UU25_C0010G0003 [Microgenomates group bacterium GW2011_GWB1_40_9]|nr:MAG: hypothetical protein UT26_C0025G0014 [Microgenomates group bacterium GW2011_GWC1_39_12]KKR79651.1 MAG: hypothetical protein UU25_C0010G0003 [Microgenomates group bacterium GW2011_GWB1_40_9]
MQHFLRHFFLPHHSNNHRAKALHIDSLLCYVLLFAILNLSIKIIHRDFPSVLGYATDIRVDALLASTNAKRISLGLNPLKLNATLSQAAAAKAQDMFSHDYWAHNSPQGKTPWSFIVNSGYKYTIAGENLAKNFSTSGGVVDAWMASPTHKDNIVKPGYQDIGFAIVNGVLNGEETTLVVQMFGAGGSPIAEVPKVETVIPEVAIAVEEPQKLVQGVGSSVFKPIFNIPTVTRDITFMFIGLIVGVLVLDGIVISRKKIVRVAGHNIAHILFFLTFFVALTMVQRGALL